MLSNDINALFAQAIDHHTQGRLADALALYDVIIRAAPNLAAAHCNRGVALQSLGRFDEAIRSYDRAIRIQPGIAEAYNNRGNALHESDRSAAALQSYDEALALKPGFAEAHHNKGKALQALQRLPEAVECYDRATRLRPDYADAYYNNGNALQELKRPSEALRNYDRAIALKPNFAEAYIGRGNALKDLNRLNEALGSYDRAINLRTDFADAYYSEANTLKELNRPQEALTFYDRAIALKADYAEAFCGRGSVLEDMNRPDEALQSFERALTLKSNFAEAHTAKGNALFRRKRFDEALQSYDRAIASRADYADAYWNKSFCALLSGNYDQGWPLYEWRKKRADATGSRNCPQPEWTGKESLEGKTLLVHAEQGLGDTIQFCRYALLAAERGAKVILAAQDRLSRLLGSLGSRISIEKLATTPASFDYHIALMSMPLAFGTTLSTCPATVPYLHAEPEKLAKWRERIGSGGFKIGICWQGNKQANVDVGRSFPVRHFEAIARLPNVRLISLQKNGGVEQLRDLPSGMKVETLGEDFDAGPDAFVDTAAAMGCLDLVITSDTAVAHLAGALARPAWVALKYVPDWRWLLDRSDSPWYPTLRLFRQPKPGDWASVFAAVRAQLTELIGRAGGP